MHLNHERAPEGYPLPLMALKREIGLWQGTALNIIDMVGKIGRAHV